MKVIIDRGIYFGFRRFLRFIDTKELNFYYVNISELIAWFLFGRLKYSFKHKIFILKIN